MHQHTRACPRAVEGYAPMHRPELVVLQGGKEVNSLVAAWQCELTWKCNCCRISFPADRQMHCTMQVRIALCSTTAAFTPQV